MKSVFLNLRRVAIFALSMLFLCAVVGCSDVSDIVPGVVTGDFPVQVGDVTIAAKPTKAVVLSPSLADVILALKYETQLAAGSEECTQPSLADLKKIAKNDVVAITALSPDLVLVDPSTNGAAPALKEAGITVLEVAPAVDRQDFERLYAQVASAFAGGGSGYDQGIDTAQDIFLTLDTINRIVPKETVTTACYLYDLESSAITGDTLASTIMSYSGVTNVFDSLEGGTFEHESLRVCNPNVIFCQPGLRDRIMSDVRFAELAAVKDGRVFEMEPTLLEWQGRTVVEAAYEISASAFPELLEENSMVVTDPTENIESKVSSVLESQAVAEEEEDTTEYETWQTGQNSEEILAIQQRLDELGYLDVEYDGYYGDYTAQCVSDFQAANDLEATGIADAATQRRLFSDNAKPKSSGDDTVTSAEPAE